MSNDATVMGYQECLAWACRMINANVHRTDENRLRGIMIKGSPGNGKTTSRHEMARRTHLQHQFMIKLAHHEVPDIAGVPVPKEETQRTHFYASFDMLPPENLQGGLLFTLDEAGDWNISQQNLGCQLIHEGRIHNWTAPDKTFYLLTANRVADRSGANRIITKLKNRLAVATLLVHPDELFEHGAGNGWNATLLAFIKMHGGERINPSDKREDAPTYFSSFDPADPAQEQFSSSRSLEFISNYLNYVDQYEPTLPDGHMLGDLASQAGMELAHKLTAFRKIAITMPDPHAILAGKKVPFPSKTEVLWALTLTLVNLVKKDSVKHMYAYLDQGPHEYLALAARLCFDTKVSELSGKDFHTMLQSPKLAAMFAK